MFVADVLRPTPKNQLRALAVLTGHASSFATVREVSTIRPPESADSSGMGTSYTFRIGGDDEEQRHRPRRLQEELDSSVGTVIDLSPGGMRVVAKRKPPKGDLQVTLIAADGDLTVSARRVWSKRRGLRRKWEFGLEFTRVDDGTRDRLARIASDHRRTMSKAA